MKIVNPLYDSAFKYLMENNRLARKVLSVILDEEIDELVVGQQETLVPYNSNVQLTLFRLDFRATIRQQDGTRKTVLVELQKSKFPSDIQRFRNYLGANYLAKDQEPAMVKEPIPGILPIITIYILGYNLDDLPYLAVTVNNEVINAISRQRVEVKSFFIEHLTHRSHIIQVRRLPLERRTRLEKFLSLFNQAWCTENNFILDLQEVPEEFSDIASYLQGPVMSEDFRRTMQAEQELDQVFGQQAQQLEELRHQFQEAEQNTIKLIQTLKQQGLLPEEIAVQSGIDLDVIKKYFS